MLLVYRYFLFVFIFHECVSVIQFSYCNLTISSKFFWKQLSFLLSKRFQLHTLRIG